MTRRGVHLIGVLLLLFPTFAQAFDTASPEEVGLSRERLARIAPAMSRQIEAKSFPGAVMLVARKGLSVRETEALVRRLQAPHAAADLQQTSVAVLLPFGDLVCCRGWGVEVRRRARFALRSRP